MAYNIDILGFNPELTHTTAQFAVGTRVQGDASAEYVYVVAGEALTYKKFVSVNSSHSAAHLTKALADAGNRIGAVAPSGGIASGSYGWVLINGPFHGYFKNGCLPSVPLYTSATAGALDDTSATQTRIYGVRCTDTATASNVARTAIFCNPTT